MIPETAETSTTPSATGITLDPHVSALEPQPVAGTSINLDGDTNQLYAGLTWDMPLAPKWSLEVSFGGALHDGPTDASGAFSYGCALNFRESISLGYQVSDRWRVYGTVTHMSNALGTVNPIEDIIRIAHLRGVPVLVDGSQVKLFEPVRLRHAAAALPQRA